MSDNFNSDSRSIKKSNFIEKQSVEAGSHMDLWNGGLNYKLSYVNFINGLGVSGSIETVGPSTAVPVLDKQGSVNGIRALTAGPGIGISIDPENGITIDHDVVFDFTGVPLTPDTEAQPLLFRSLVAGGGIGISGDGDTIQITAVDTPTSAKTVTVFSINDLPAAVGGEITLLPDLVYEFLNDVNFGATRLVMGDNSSIIGVSPEVIKLTYTDVGVFITSTDTSWRLEKVTIDCELGTLMACTNTVFGKSVQINDATIDPCDKLGTIDGYTVVKFLDSYFGNIGTDGLTFSGSQVSFVCDVCYGIMNGGTLFDLGTAQFDGLILTANTLILGSGTSFLDGQIDSGNITVNGFASITDNRISGPGTPLVNISIDDVLFGFSGNDIIPDSRTDALLTMQGNVTATTITVAGTPVLVAGTWVVESSSRIAATAAGRITYNGYKDTKLPLTASLTVEPVTGPEVTLAVYIAIDGVFQPGSKRTATVASGSQSSITAPWLDTLTTGQYVEVFVANDTNTNNVLVSSAVWRAN